MKHTIEGAIAFALAFVPAAAAHAYVGPGAGLGALGALWLLLVAVLLALAVAITWPLRRVLRVARRRNRARMSRTARSRVPGSLDPS